MLISEAKLIHFTDICSLEQIRFCEISLFCAHPETYGLRMKKIVYFSSMQNKYEHQKLMMIKSQDKVSTAENKHTNKQTN